MNGNTFNGQSSSIEELNNTIKGMSGDLQQLVKGLDCLNGQLAKDEFKHTSLIGTYIKLKIVGAIEDIELKGRIEVLTVMFEVEGGFLEIMQDYLVLQHYFFCLENDDIPDFCFKMHGAAPEGSYPPYECMRSIHNESLKAIEELKKQPSTKINFKSS